MNPKVDPRRRSELFFLQPLKTSAVSLMLQVQDSDAATTPDNERRIVNAPNVIVSPPLHATEICKNDARDLAASSIVR
jgi:hypothetical protein